MRFQRSHKSLCQNGVVAGEHVLLILYSNLRSYLSFSLLLFTDLQEKYQTISFVVKGRSRYDYHFALI